MGARVFTRPHAKTLNAVAPTGVDRRARAQNYAEEINRLLRPGVSTLGAGTTSRQGDPPPRDPSITFDWIAGVGHDGRAM